MSEVTLTIKQKSGDEFSITVKDTATIKEVKEACVELAKLPLEDIRLIFKGKILKDEMTLSEYKIENGLTVHLVQSSESKGTGAPGTGSSGETPST